MPQRPNSGWAKELKISFELLPKNTVSGFNGRWHRMFGFYVTCHGSDIVSQLRVMVLLLVTHHIQGLLL